MKGGQGVYHVFKTTFVEDADPAFNETGRSLHDVLGEQRAKMRAEIQERIAEGKGAIANLDDDVGDSEEAGDAKGSYTDL